MCVTTLSVGLLHSGFLTLPADQNLFLFFEPAVPYIYIYIYPVTPTEIGSRYSSGYDIPQSRDVKPMLLVASLDEGHL